MIDYKLYPALLSTPGNKPERFDKASDYHASGIVLDLEDSVSLAQKNEARRQVLHYLKHVAVSHKLLYLIRINSLSSQEGLKDLLAISQEQSIQCHGIIHPKTETPEVLNLLNDVLLSVGMNIPLLALIETATGLNNVHNIVASANNIAGLMLGAADYATDVGLQITQNSLLWTRSQLANAAALKQIACYDAPKFNFKEPQELQDDIRHAFSLGFSGKLAIHPNQIKSINDGFCPSWDSYNEAKQIIVIYEAAKGAACEYNGKMIDIPVYKKAKQVEEIFEILNKKG